MKNLYRRLIDIKGSDLNTFEKQQIRGGTEPICEPGNDSCFCKYVDENENMTNLGEVTFYHTGGSIIDPSLGACLDAGHSTTNQAACSLVGEN